MCFYYWHWLALLGNYHPTTQLCLDFNCETFIHTKHITLTLLMSNASNWYNAFCSSLVNRGILIDFASLCPVTQVYSLNTGDTD